MSTPRRQIKSTTPLPQWPWGWSLICLLLTLVVSSWFVYYLRDVFSALLTAFALAYIFNPLINRLEAHGAKRNRAVILLMLLVIISLSGFLLFVAPLIASQVVDFVVVLPSKLQRIYANLDTYLSTRWGYPLPQSGGEIIDHLRQYLETHYRELIKPLGLLLGSTFSNAVEALSFILKLLIVPMLMIYLLVDFHSIKARLRELVPRRYIPFANETVVQLNDIMAGFFRGQLVLIFCMAIYYSSAFLLIGMPMGLLIGFTAGIGHLVPYLGPLVSAVLGLIMLLADASELSQFLGFAAVLAVAQVLESFVLTPRLVGKRLGLSPVTTIVALLVFSKLLGFLGVLMAIPLAAVSKILMHHGLKHYKASALYQRD